MAPLNWNTQILLGDPYCAQKCTYWTSCEWHRELSTPTVTKRERQVNQSQAKDDPNTNRLTNDFKRDIAWLLIAGRELCQGASHNPIPFRRNSNVCTWSDEVQWPVCWEFLAADMEFCRCVGAPQDPRLFLPARLPGTNINFMSLAGELLSWILLTVQSIGQSVNSLLVKILSSRSVYSRDSNNSSPWHDMGSPSPRTTNLSLPLYSRVALATRLRTWRSELDSRQKQKTCPNNDQLGSGAHSTSKRLAAWEFHQREKWPEREARELPRLLPGLIHGAIPQFFHTPWWRGA